MVESPGLAGDEKRVNPADSQALRSSARTVASAMVCWSNAGTGEAVPSPVAISSTAPDAMIVLREVFPVKAPSAIRVHELAMLALAPRPAGAAMRVRVSPSSFRLYRMPSLEMKADAAVLPAFALATVMAVSLMHRENTQAGTVAISAGSTALPSKPSGTRVRRDRSLVKSMPLYEAYALLSASTLTEDAFGNSWKKPGSMEPTVAGMVMEVTRGALSASAQRSAA